MLQVAADPHVVIFAVSCGSDSVETLRAGLEKWLRLRLLRCAKQRCASGEHD